MTLQDLINSGLQGIAYPTPLGLFVCLLIAAVIGIAAYILFIKPINGQKFTGGAETTRQIFSFEKTFVEKAIVPLYAILAVYFLCAFVYDLIESANFFSALVTFLGQEIALRLGFEVVAMIIAIYRKGGAGAAPAVEAAPADAAPQMPPPPPACSKCGTLITSGDKFCAVCGNKLK